MAGLLREDMVALSGRELVSRQCAGSKVCFFEKKKQKTFVCLR
jgi:hypothetical protein